MSSSSSIKKPSFSSSSRSSFSSADWDSQTLAPKQPSKLSKAWSSIKKAAKEHHEQVNTA
ncbi:hypothetical protein LTS18_011735, partial [Coniosporium uncinatum]